MKALSVQPSLSESLARRAASVIAGTMAHDSWCLESSAVAFERADGAIKWDVDGRAVIDYWMGHGALLCGHGFPPVVEAVQRQAARGCHLSGLHESQVRWAELIQKLIPSAERVRFTSSGTEATLLALRVARSYTGNPLVVRFDGHYHGWHDEALAHFVPSQESGLMPHVEQTVGLADESNLDTVADWLETGDIAAVILEPGGGASGAMPYNPERLRQLRRLTSEYGAMLIFDEVVSGFRDSPSGVQGLSGVVPDLTVLAKILSGGLPGGAIAGRADVMAVFGKGTTVNGRKARVHHAGTFNANPLSAVAGSAMLSNISDGTAQIQAASNTAALAARINQAACRIGVDVAVYHRGSVFHIVIGASQAGTLPEASSQALFLYKTGQQHYIQLRYELLREGVDCHPIHGWVSATHNGDVIDRTVDAFTRAFRNLIAVNSSLQGATVGCSEASSI